MTQRVTVGNKDISVNESERDKYNARSTFIFHILSPYSLISLSEEWKTTRWKVQSVKMWCGPQEYLSALRQCRVNMYVRPKLMPYQLNIE